MGRSLRQFAASMEKRADVVEGLGNRLVVAGVMAGVEHAVAITPVDTSEALSNWQVFLNNPPADNLPPFVPGKHGSTRQASADLTIQAAQAELAFRKPGQVTYLSNLAPHIGKLDQGWSRQFAGGFTPRVSLAIRLAVERAVATDPVFKG